MSRFKDSLGWYLERVVAVVPSMAILQGTKLVGEFVTLGDRALSDSIDTVHMIRI